MVGPPASENPLGLPVSFLCSIVKWPEEDPLQFACMSMSVLVLEFLCVYLCVCVCWYVCVCVSELEPGAGQADNPTLGPRLMMCLSASVTLLLSWDWVRTAADRVVNNGSQRQVDHYTDTHTRLQRHRLRKSGRHNHDRETYFQAHTHTHTHRLRDILSSTHTHVG